MPSHWFESESEDETHMLKREYTQDGHVSRLSVSRRADAGWEVREERDNRVVRRAQLTDWHRVERALQVFELQKLSGDREIG
jgi:hypothetical protein